MPIVNRADPVLSIDDLSDYLKISKSTLYKLAQGGRVPGQKVGKHWRFHRDAIDAWLKQTPEENAKPPQPTRSKR